MQEVENLHIGIRDVGESIISTSQDIRVLLKSVESNDNERLSSYKHSTDLVENILSMLVFLSNIRYKELDKYEELLNQVRQIELSCLALRSIILEHGSSMSNNNIPQNHEIEGLLITINKAAYKLITLSFMAKQSVPKLKVDDGKPDSLEEINNQLHDDQLPTHSVANVNSDICYKSKDLCELDCFGGTCYENTPGSEYLSDADDVCYASKANCEENCNGGSCYEEPEINQIDKNIDKCYNTEEMCIKECRDGECYGMTSYEYHQGNSCPENAEHFTESPFTHVENGYIDDDKNNIVNEDGEKVIICPSKDAEIPSNLINKRYPINQYFIEVILMAKTDFTGYNYNEVVNKARRHSQIDLDDTKSRIYDSRVTDEQIAKDTNTDSYETTKYSYETNTDSYETTTDRYETSTSDYEIYTENYDSTTEGYEVTEESTTTYYESATQSYFTSEESTTPTYETTTEDLYKVSQDIYAVAQDLSTKANEISSMSSDISSKVSDISSMVNDLNSYDDDELSKKVQSISKMTQDISSKTSEISSLSSTTSSLASDISSASSDMTSVDRNHPFRTTPWQKMSSKSQDMITSTQSIITAAQDILMKIDSVVTATSDMVVADRVTTLGYDVTSRIQRLISESLNIMTAVIDLMHVIDS